MLAVNSRKIESLARDVARDDKGTIAIIFALCIMVIFLVTGLAIDVGRVMHAERKLAAAIDAAALAAAKGLRTQNLSDTEVEEMAQRYFEANMQGGGNYAHVQSFSVNVDRNNNSVAIDVASEVPMIFANVAGISKISVPKGSVAIYDTKDIEIGLQLDVTGSMCQPCSKIAALKDAVAGPDGMLDILMPDGGTTNSVRIGLAPFAAGVNAGDYITAVSGGRNPSDKCVYERADSALQAADASPAGAGRFLVRSELSGASACPGHANRVVAMTDSKSDLRSAVNGLTTGGSTAGHLGAAWAWGLVSPEWSSIWGGTAPAPYGDGRTEKYVILMTDGDYNTVGGVQNQGVNGPVSNQHAENTCTAMKDKGVVVFTIGFQVSNAAKNRLKSCASSASKFYDANDAQTLRNAFRAIAEEINSLRLSS
ncbi:MAG: pilus assembly protein TadG-related protein [Hyphomicrobiaceae bacterium]